MQWAFGEYGKDTPGSSQALLYYGVSLFGCPSRQLYHESILDYHSLRFFNKTSKEYSVIDAPLKEIADIHCSSGSETLYPYIFFK